jgi:hypothetical protein
MAPSSEELADFFRTRKIEFGKCLEPLMQCDQPAIRAHSIQNRQTIALLEEDNHVIAWQPRFSKAGPEIKLRRICRNDASTFAGFCNKHDTDLFQPLDTKSFDITDREQLFLLAYRGITCELHAIMLGVVQIQNLYIGRVERGADSPDETSPAGRRAVEQMLLSWTTWRYRHKYYDEPLLSESFTSIEHDVIVMNNQPPCLAASSFFTLKDAPVADDLVGAAINVLPVGDTRTVVVFSYPSQDRGTVRAAPDRILNAQGHYQKYELSKLILSRISNVLISPRQFKNWGEAKAKKITEAFVKTIYTQQDVEDNLELMLF